MTENIGISDQVIVEVTRGNPIDSVADTVTEVIGGNPGFVLDQNTLAMLVFFGILIYLLFKKEG